MQDKRLTKVRNASIIAIIVNVALGIFKAIVGLISHSVAITMDAINNFTDAASSFITILAAYFASKHPDKKHPFGYGRTEYLGTLLIGGLISYAGITALIESVKKIIHPEVAEYSTISLIIVGVAVFVKIFLALYIIKVGKDTKSDSLVASGKEAIGDIAISIATIVAALLYVFANISIEAWLGVIISFVIIKAGVETLKETVDNILGTPADISLVTDVKKAINEHENVRGAYDLVLHDYGPDSYMATVHIAVDNTCSIDEFDNITREIQTDISERFGINLSSVGVYSVNVNDERIIKIREEVSKAALADKNVHQLHGFYINEDKKEMRFDLVISFDSDDRHKTYDEALKRISEKYPDYKLYAGLDTDYNELSKQN